MEKWKQIVKQLMKPANCQPIIFIFYGKISSWPISFVAKMLMVKIPDMVKTFSFYEIHDIKNSGLTNIGISQSRIQGKGPH